MRKDFLPRVAGREGKKPSCSEVRDFIVHLSKVYFLDKVVFVLLVH